MIHDSRKFRGHRFCVDGLPDGRFRWRAKGGGWISSGSKLCLYWGTLNEFLSGAERTYPTPKEAHQHAEEAIERHIRQDECRVNS